MSEYNHILIGISLTEKSQGVPQRASALQTAFNARLSCVHVIEPLSLAYGGDIPMDLSTIQEQIQDIAKTHLTEFSRSLGIEEQDRHLIFGRPETEILTLANDIDADLIVVGSHGRHGFARLLGSLANDMVQSAPCDVLAVRVET